MPERIARLIVIAFCLLLVLIPLPFGSNRMWAANLFALLSGAMLFGYMLCLLRAPDLSPARFTPPLIFAGILVGIVVLWAVMQFTGLTPESWYHPLWGETQQVLAAGGYKGGVESAVAVNSAASYQAMVRFLGYVACFWLTYFIAARSDDAKLLLRVFIAAALLYAIYGLALEILGLKQILWYPKVSYVDNLTSTFVNRNSYASYAGMGLVAAAGYVALRWRRAFDRFDPRAWGRDFLQIFVARELVWAALPLVIFAALLLAESRMGFLSALVGLFVFGLAFAINQHVRLWKIGVMVAVLLVIVGGLFVLGGSGLSARLQETQLADDAQARLTVYEITADAIATNPWLGYGWGNFDSAFRQFNTVNVQGIFHKAHSDWLEIPMELGVPAALLLLLVYLTLGWRCWQGVLQRRKDGIYSAIGLAVLVTLGIHSLIDFPLQIPANGMTFAVLLGLGVAQSYSSRERA
jgi:O-antigen ligase